ncbi:MAG: FAD-dependent oxidoreductase [Eubacteriales bacterium]
MKYDIAIFGGGIGGVQAATSACAMGCTVYLSEETDWLGGQLSSQGVPPDEHPWIEQQGATKRYLDYRKQVRNYYKNRTDATVETKQNEELHIGNSWVSHLCHEPMVAAKLLAQQLEPYEKKGLLTIDFETKMLDCKVISDTIDKVIVTNGKEEKEIIADYYLDATECGDLLPLSGTEYHVGAEAKMDTNEPSAPEVADVADMQPITWVAALELFQEEAPEMEKPAMYDAFVKTGVPYGENKLFSWEYFSDATQQTVSLRMLDNELGDGKRGFWSYRRVLDPKQFQNVKNEMSLLNWPQNDYRLGNVFDTNDAPIHLEMAKQQTLCFAYWLRYDAPRSDGGTGYPVALCKETFGTENGLAKAPYIRESRRIVAHHIICEQEVSRSILDKPTIYEDSVGVGSYAMDLHPTTRSHRSYYAATWPFEIPLGALLPIRIKNLLPACKNIGTTHMTNGCYRLHPVEWNVGESVGYLAGFCVKNNVTPEKVWKERCSEFLQMLEENGIQRHWDFKDMDI